MRIEIRSANRGFTWALVARNGKQTANNEVFANQSGATRAAKAVVASIVRAAGGGAYTWKHATRADALVLTMERTP